MEEMSEVCMVVGTAPTRAPKCARPASAHRSHICGKFALGAPKIGIEQNEHCGNVPFWVPQGQADTTLKLEASQKTKKSKTRKKL
jgi:hypothetical protein